MYIDIVVLYVYQYCRSIDINVIIIDIGNVIIIYIKIVDIVILVIISFYLYYLKISQLIDGYVILNYVFFYLILYVFFLNF